MSVVAERLAALPIHLDFGTHRTFDQGHCALEVVSWLAGERFSDKPACVSPVLRRYVTRLNDQWNGQERQRLVPYLPGLVGTAGDGQDEARTWLALDWLVRVYTPTWLDGAGLAWHAASLRETRGPGTTTHASPTPHAAWDAAWDAVDDGTRVAATAASLATALAAGWATDWHVIWTEPLRTSALDLLARMTDPRAS